MGLLTKRQTVYSAVIKVLDKNGQPLPNVTEWVCITSRYRPTLAQVEKALGRTDKGYTPLILQLSEMHPNDWIPYYKERVQKWQKNFGGIYNIGLTKLDSDSKPVGKL